MTISARSGGALCQARIELMEFVRAARGLLALVQQAVGELSAVSPFPYFLFSFPLVFCKSLRSFIAGLYRRHHLQHCFWLVVHLNYQVAFLLRAFIKTRRAAKSAGRRESMYSSETGQFASAAGYF